MTVMSILPQSRPLTREDLEAMPDDGHRYELLDGALIVSPAPEPLHQHAVASLLVLLRHAASRDLWVLTSPLDVALANDTVLQPDVVQLVDGAHAEVGRAVGDQRLCISEPFEVAFAPAELVR